MLSVSQMDVWSVTIDDRPGALKQKLEKLAMAGADLEFLVSRRLHDTSGKGIAFVTPLEGEKQVQIAKDEGFKKFDGLHSVRIKGPDEPGIAYRILSDLADEGINLRGVSAASLGDEFVMYLAFDTAVDAQKAVKRLSGAI